MKRSLTSMYKDRLGKRFWCQRKVKGVNYKGLQPFNLTFKNGDHLVKDNPDSKVILKTLESKVIFPESLESVRLTLNRLLGSKLGRVNYYIEIKKYPHLILREHRMAKGAKADRISEGMRRAFGKANRRAIRIKEQDTLIVIYLSTTARKQLSTIKPIIDKTSSKLSSRVTWIQS